MAPAVSIVLATFNHESFVAQAIDSIVRQDCFARAEVVVADDCSTDSTSEIIAKFCEVHENVRVVAATENVGTNKNYLRALATCRGEHVALLEGDDYWTSPTKISRQIAFLEANPDCTATITQCRVLDVQTGKSRIQPRLGAAAYRRIDTRDLIAANVIGTFSTCLYRSPVLKEVMDRALDVRGFDWIVNMAVADRGWIGAIPGIDCVYRVHRGGQWSGKSPGERLDDLLQACDEYNRFFDGRYAQEFETLRRKLTEISAKATPDGFV